MNRRQYIDRVARGGLLGAMAVLTGILVSRRQVSEPASCSEQTACAHCRKLNKCDRPEAQKEREAKA